MHVSKKSGLKSRVYGVFTTQSDIKLMVKVLEQVMGRSPKNRYIFLGNPDRL